MLYLTGVYALNIENSSNTCGDWHTSSLNWRNIELVESSDSIFQEWGIEVNKSIPEHNEKYNVANDLRAILDLLQQKSKLRYLKGFYNDFICTDEYNSVFFEKVALLRSLPHWKDINNLMKREFMYKWLNYIKEVD